MGCSGEQKETVMVLKVDLQCCECYLKVKRLLCKFPQIRDQVFDEKQNTVTITVVCCTPERIRDKLCSKGRKSIKSIEIKKSDAEKPKSKPEDKPKQAAPSAPVPVPVPVPVEAEKPKPKPKAAPEPQAPAPAPAQEKPPEKLQKNGSKSGSKNGSKTGSKNGSKSEAAAEAKPADNPAPKQAEAAPAPKEPAQEAPKPKAAEPEAQWVPGYPPAPAPPPQQAQQTQMSLYPVAICCTPCYDGVPGGPCYQGGGYGYAYGRPSYPPPPGYYPSSANRCSDYSYFSEENPSACSIM